MTDDVHALTGAYALDALPPDERLEFEQHLRGCGACRREVTELRTTCAEIGTADEHAVPDSLRAGVFAAIEGEAGDAVQWAIGALLGAETRQDVVDVVVAFIERIGGEVVPAEEAGEVDDRVLPLDVGFGGTPLLPVAASGSRARRDLEHHLPQLVEDARQTLERIRRTGQGHEQRTGARESGSGR